MKKLLLSLFPICISILSIAQARQVIGNVTDEAGTPLSGANVLLSGSKTDVVTKLERNTAGLEDVVVVGYSSVKQKDITASVSSLGSKDLKDNPSNAAARAPAGKLAGVQVNVSEGTPGADVDLFMGGRNSITQSGAPLYVVEAIQVENALSVLSPQDIENITVLKDTASTAIYGARGANGVFLITTKGGKNTNGKTTVTYNTFYGVNNISRKLDMMGPYNFVLYAYERAKYTENAADTAVTAINQRVKWAKQLNEAEAKQYSAENIFSDKNFTATIPTTNFFDFAAFSHQQPIEMPLYKNGVPNSTGAANKENSATRDNVTSIAKVSVPTLTFYKAAKPNGRSVIICPGGAYSILAFDKEGTRVAEEMNRWGVTAFVLKYRLPDDTTMIDRSIAPLQDAQQAVRLIRSNAKEWGVDRNKIGIMGFSAGGHLASTAATHFDYKADTNNKDTTSVRPDFAVLVYPVISFDSAITHKGSRNNLVGANASDEKIKFFSNELQVTKNTPPSFLVHAGDDGAVPVDNSIRYYQACIKNKVVAELHLYPAGGHGFGMNNKTTTDNWMERLRNWLDNLK